MDRRIISNCIVSRRIVYNKLVELNIRPITMEKRLNPKFNIDSIQKITTGIDLEDKKLLNQLCQNKITFEQLLNYK